MDVSENDYSFLKLSIGFPSAAFNALTLTVITVIKMIIPAVIKTAGMLNVIRFAKVCNHISVPYQVIGIAMMKAIKTNRKKSFDNNATVCCTEAPNIFLTLFLWFVDYK